MQESEAFGEVIINRRQDWLQGEWEGCLCLVLKAEARSPGRELQILGQLLHSFHLTIIKYNNWSTLRAFLHTVNMRRPFRTLVPFLHP